MVIYYLSLIFIIHVFIRNKIGFNSIIHWIFLGFIILYNFFPLLLSVYLPKMNRMSLSLYSNHLETLYTGVMISGMVVFTYAFVILFNKEKYNLDFSANRIPNIKFNPFILYFMFYPLGLYFSSKYNWTSGSRVGLGFSLTAYTRNLLEVLGIISFIKYRKYNLKRLVILISFIILSYIDTQRTNLFILFIAFIITLKENKKMKIYFALLIASVSLIGIVRNGVNILNILYPFIGEGVLGSYGFFQSVDIVKNNYNFGLLLTPLNGLINLFSHYLGINLNLYTTGDYMGEMLKRGILKEKYFPMGGYYFPANSHLILPYLGPIIQTLIFLFIVYKITNYKKDAYLKIIIYSNLFLYIKANVVVATNLIIFQLICYYFYRFINSIFIISLGKKNKSYFWEVE